jgi:hypothetical protein
MVYVPLARHQARRLRDSGVLVGPLTAHAVTAGLLRAHDLSGDAEDADYTALAYAGVSALLASGDPLRLVVAAEVDQEVADDDPDDAFGRVTIGRLDWSRVSSLFVDEAASTDRIAQARSLAAGLELEAVVDAEEVEALLDASDLLWFAPAELDRLPGANTESGG